MCSEWEKKYIYTYNTRCWNQEIGILIYSRNHTTFLLLLWLKYNSESKFHLRSHRHKTFSSLFCRIFSYIILYNCSFEMRYYHSLVLHNNAMELFCNHFRWTSGTRFRKKSWKKATLVQISFELHAIRFSSTWNSVMQLKHAELKMIEILFEIN